MPGSNSVKCVMLPPQSSTTRDWAKRLADMVPETRVVVAEDADTAAREIVDAEAAFGWLGGDVFHDLNKNGERDPGEPLIPNTDLDQRWRDGSIKEATFTDAFGHYAVRLPDGDWTVQVAMPSGRVYPVSQITISGGQITDNYGRDIPSLIISR